MRVHKSGCLHKHVTIDVWVCVIWQLFNGKFINKFTTNIKTIYWRKFIIAKWYDDMYTDTDTDTGRVDTGGEVEELHIYIKSPELGSCVCAGSIMMLRYLYLLEIFLATNQSTIFSLFLTCFPLLWSCSLPATSTFLQPQIEEGRSLFKSLTAHKSSGI